MSLFLRYASILFFWCVVVFGLHVGALYYLQFPLLANKIVWAYLVNFLLATAIMGVVLHPPSRFKDNAGFLFMFGGLIKFIFFFIFFYPSFLQDGNISRAEFFAFFAPYATCLFVNTKLLIHKLSKD